MKENSGSKTVGIADNTTGAPITHNAISGNKDNHSTTDLGDAAFRAAIAGAKKKMEDGVLDPKVYEAYAHLTWDSPAEKSLKMALRKEILSCGTYTSYIKSTFTSKRGQTLRTRLGDELIKLIELADKYVVSILKKAGAHTLATPIFLVQHVSADRLHAIRRRFEAATAADPLGAIEEDAEDSAQVHSDEPDGAAAMELRVEQQDAKSAVKTIPGVTLGSLRDQVKCLGSICGPEIMRALYGRLEDVELENEATAGASPTTAKVNNETGEELVPLVASNKLSMPASEAILDIVPATLADTSSSPNNKISIAAFLPH